MGLFTPQRRVSFQANLVIFALGVLIPLTLMLLRVDGRIVFACVVVTPLVWSVVWRDLGFVLGLFFFWGAAILVTSHARSPDEVDNMLPGLAVAFGWLPYVVFFGPMFLVMKSMDRVRSQPVENISRKPENSEY